MRMSGEEKERSHARIVASAARLVRERGTEGANVLDVMREAGLTQGGFYKHFGSKEAMLAAGLDLAFDEIAALLGPDLPASEDARLGAAFSAFYLSDQHLAAPGLGCPLAALGGEVARDGAALRARFGAGARRILDLLARGMPGAGPVRRARAARRLAMLVGAIVIARASDPETAREVLAACRAEVSRPPGTPRTAPDPQ